MPTFIREVKGEIEPPTEALGTWDELHLRASDAPIAQPVEPASRDETLPYLPYQYIEPTERLPLPVAEVPLTQYPLRRDTVVLDNKAAGWAAAIPPGQKKPRQQYATHAHKMRPSWARITLWLLVVILMVEAVLILLLLVPQSNIPSGERTPLPAPTSVLPTTGVPIATPTAKPTQVSFTPTVQLVIGGSGGFLGEPGDAVRTFYGYLRTGDYISARALLAPKIATDFTPERLQQFWSGFQAYNAEIQVGNAHVSGDIAQVDIELDTLNFPQGPSVELHREGGKWYITDPLSIDISTPTSLPTQEPFTQAPSPTSLPNTETPHRQQTWPEYERGDTGSNVFVIQYLLNAHQFGSQADGIFGTDTEKQVKLFQGSRNLEANGKVDSPTWEQLVVEIQEGNSGDAVRALQRGLTDKFNYKGDVDGIFGNETDMAVREFQVAHGLDANGVIGANTWVALVSAAPGHELR
jgi:peptidoglycan hydrolase-like protein with peptidoglycan-binding domain